MNCKHLIAAAAIAITGAGAASAQSVYGESTAMPVPVAATPEVSQQPLSRVEVQADWNLWQMAGLNKYQTGERSAASSPLYQERFAAYQRMRSGPEYIAEVRRLGGDVSAVAYMYERGMVPTTY